MISMKQNLIFLLVVVAAVPAWSFSPEWRKQKQEEIEQIIAKAKVPKKDLGLLVLGGETGKDEVFALNANDKKIPASITKLVTAAATLRAFPPGTKFKTQIYLSGKDLYLKGGGDPSFVSETMWYLVNAFTRTGIKKVEGDIIVDDSLFDRERYDSSRQSTRVDRAYDAPTGAMSFNWNSVNIFVRPANKSGEPAIVTVDPENEYIQLDAKVQTTSGSSATLSADRADGKNGDRLVVRGKIGVGSKEMVIFKNITQPDIWSGTNLKGFLAQRGVSVTGKVRTGKTPQTAKLMAEAESKPIEDVLSDMNKFSNNYVAEMLTKNVAVSVGKEGSIKNGIAELKSYLSGLKVSDSDYVLENPSGLTNENRFTPNSLMKVLLDMKGQFQYQPEFVTSLPIAGIDGTMKNRLKGTAGERWVRAKTGFLTGVVSLAGYAGLREGSVLSFVFIFNGSADESKVRQLYDQILLALIN